MHWIKNGGVSDVTLSGIELAEETAEKSRANLSETGEDLQMPCISVKSI